MKSIVAVGGGFSSGKSALASSFFKHDEIKLPIGIEPVTANQALELSDVDWDFLASASIPVDVLKKLAGSDEWEARLIAAKKANTSDSVVKSLLNDSDSDVRKAAAKSLRSRGYDIVDDE